MALYITPMQRPIDPHLDQLKELLNTMASDVEQAIAMASDAWVRLDPSSLSASSKIDRKIKGLQLEIDNHCFRMIALQNPCASDLRLIVASVKVNNHLGRMAELAFRITADTDSYLKVSSDVLISDLTGMCHEVVSMVQQAVRAFLTSDTGLARQVLSRENRIDEMKRSILDQALKRMRAKSALTEPAVYSVFIAKNLERIADHATKVAEDMVFAVSGERTDEPRLFAHRNQEHGC